MPSLAVTGTEQLRAVGRDLRRAGSPARGIRKKLRRNLVAAAQPIKRDAQANVRAIPVTSGDHTGLRDSIARATRVRVKASSRTALVRVEVNPKKAPLAWHLEGDHTVPWRHPLFGNRNHWYDQRPHPYFLPAVTKNLPGVTLAAVKAIEETALEIERGF